jgi:hypothetical protein
VIFRRPRYRRDGPRVPIKTGTQIHGLEHYLEDQDHPNHQLGITVGALQYWRVCRADFIPTIEMQAEAYRAKPKGRGAPWKGEIAEHVIFAPPPGAWLSEAERRMIADHVLEQLSPASPAAYVWHVGEDGRDELHLIMSYFTDGTFPELRITAVRSDHDGDYRELAMKFGRAAIALVNQSRDRFRLANPAIDAPQPVLTLADIRRNKRAALGFSPLPEILFKALGPADCLDKTSIVDWLKSRRWGVRSSGRNISVVPPDKKKPYRWPWETLLREIYLLRDEWRKSLEKPSRQFGKEDEDRRSAQK